MPHLSLSLLGTFAAELDGESVMPLHTRKVQGLFAYLVAERVLAPGMIPRRETLMALLWPAMPDSSARQNLRQAAYLLRRTVPAVGRLDGGEPPGDVPLLLADYHTVQINPASSYQLDLEGFLRLAATREPGDMERAVALYRGDFLAHLYMDDSNEFESWAARRRAALRRQVLTILEALAGYWLFQGDYQAAERYARRQIDIEPLHEEGHRQLIEALARRGRRSAALAAHDDLVLLFKRELDLAPSAQTQQLIAEVRANTL